MTAFVIAALDQQVADSVRAMHRSPGYGHPVATEIATGTGPCRSCLTAFRPGRDERLLFTYQPGGGSASVGAPGPVFIRSETCRRFQGPSFPSGLLEFPLMIEARTEDGRVLRSEAVEGVHAQSLIEELLADSETDFVFLRHGEAGCHIARANRAGDMGAA